MIDSHCHLHSLDLTDFNDDIGQVLAQAQSNGVSHCLCVCIESEDVNQLYQIADNYAMVSISVGIHPNAECAKEPSFDDLVLWARHPSCIAIGETGLDYFRNETLENKQTQQQRFRTHIQASLHAKKPLIIHTRAAAADTIALMQEEQAQDIGGVMHCFTETWDVAKQALDLGFYISFSGIITFKNATQIQEVAKKVPLDRMLIETDAPYLAPVPFRGQQNQPAWVKHVAQAVAQLRQLPLETITNQTTDNFYRCFRVAES